MGERQEIRRTRADRARKNFGRDMIRSRVDKRPINAQLCEASVARARRVWDNRGGPTAPSYVMSDPATNETPDSGPTASNGLPELGSVRLEQFGAAVRADPERIGPYRILGRLGEGGMGIVFRAEQREPVRRTVAIKLI